MPAFISIPLDNKDPTVSRTSTKKEYSMDFNCHRITSRKISGIEAVEQTIRKKLLTPRYKCLIYPGSYGSEIAELLRNSPSQAFLNSSIENIVKDAIIHDDRIISVYNFSFKQIDDYALISFDVSTIYGETGIEEVITGV